MMYFTSTFIEICYQRFHYDPHFPKTGQFQCHYCWMSKALIMLGTGKLHKSYSNKTKK